MKKIGCINVAVNFDLKSKYNSSFTMSDLTQGIINLNGAMRGDFIHNIFLISQGLYIQFYFQLLIPPGNLDIFIMILKSSLSSNI